MFNNIPVYDIEQIYYQKIMAIAGTYLVRDEYGKERHTGRNSAKGVYDLYCLSSKLIPIHDFLRTF